jgi:hypothetical protein
MFENDEGHVCDWRLVGMRQDSHVEVMCLAEGHNINTKWRVAPKLVHPGLLPEYDGFADV